MTHTVSLVTDPLTDKLEEKLPPWTRELLGCLTEREREAFVLRETGSSLGDAGDHLGVSRERIGDLVESATRKMTDAARQAVLLHKHVPSIQPHAPPVSCKAEQCRVPEAMRRALDLPTEVLGLTWRAVTCLREGKVVYIGHLVQRREYELLRINGLGRKTVREIRNAVTALGLHFGMEVEDWAPPNARTPATEPSRSKSEE